VGAIGLPDMDEERVLIVIDRGFVKDPTFNPEVPLAREGSDPFREDPDEWGPEPCGRFLPRRASENRELCEGNTLTAS
jgi:hypothetical protein